MSKHKKINFLKSKKDSSDKFYDLVKEYIKPVFYNTEEMEIMGLKERTFKKYKGISELSKKLKTSPSTIKKAIQRGINKGNRKLIKNINNQFSKLSKEYKKKGIKLENFKKSTKEFTVHNFTRQNFFKKPKKRLKKNERYHFRAGIYIYFERVKKVSTGANENKNEKQNVNYVINNFTVSSQSKNFNKGYEKIFEDIKYEMKTHPSLKYFRFNYFDVIVVDIGK